MKYLVSILLTLILIVSCNPIEIPDPKNDQPVFNSSMEIDGHVVKFESGTLGIINNPTIGLKNKNQLSYYSVFSNKDCVRPCPNSLIFGFNSEVVYNARTFDFDHSFPKANKNYNWLYENNLITLRIEASKKNIRVLKLEEQWWQGTNAIDAKWNVVNNTSTTSKSFNADKSKQICRRVRIAGDNNAVFISCKDVSNLQKLQGTDLLEVGIEIKRTGRKEYTLTAITSGDNSSLQYEWDNDPTKNGKTIKITTLAGTKHRVKVYNRNLNVKSSAAIWIQREVFMDDYSKVMSSYKITKSTRPTNKDKIQAGSVSIKYVNANGKILTSNTYKSPNDRNSKFKIISVEDYVEEDSMDKYKKVTVGFECMLFDERGVLHQLKNGEASIALKMPR